MGLADLDDPNSKLFNRDRGRPIQGPGGPGPGGGGGARGVAGGPFAGVAGGPGGPDGASLLRALLKKRLLGARGVPYQVPGGPVSAPAPADTASNVMGLAPWQRGGASPLGPAPGGIQFPGGGHDPGVIPEGQRTGDTTDRSYGNPNVAPFVGLDLLIKFLQAGSLGPNPSGAILDSVRGRALDDAEAARSRSELAAQSLGADPATAASYALRAGLQGQSDVSKAVNNSVTDQLTARQDFGQRLLMQLIQGVLSERAASAGNQGGGTDYGGLLGGLGGLIGGLKKG